jgi:hypothetical protein
MKSLYAQILGLTMLVLWCMAGMAQEDRIEPGTERPMFTRLPATLHNPKNAIEAASTPLQTWNGSFTYNGTNYSYNMVGAAPTAGTTATITTYVIPIKIVLSNGKTYDPATTVNGTYTAVTNTTDSPIFNPSVDFTSGGVDLSKSQYIDAFQRANFGGSITSPSHLLLGGPTVLAEQTLNVPKRYGSTGSVFGFTAGLVDINYFDAQLHTLITNLGITPNTFPIFLTYNIYLTQNHSCCIGGYHSSTGSSSAPQAYAHATYVSKVGAFAQDVSALSHEVGEWADDPLVVTVNGNNTPCGILEVGDPLENNANYGAYTYIGSNGFTYNLQDLTTLPYFGAPASTSVNGEFTFQGEKLSVCQNGS